MINANGAALLVLISLAALHDIQYRRIPNSIIISIAALWVAYAFWSSDAEPLASLGVAAAVLAAGMLCWRLRWLGGGDAKLIAALSLWAGPEQTLPMLSAVALAGGMLAMVLAVARQPAVTLLLAYVALHRGGGQAGDVSAGERSGVGTAQGWPESAGSLPVPYGVAIAAGGYWLIHRLFIG